MDLDLRLIFISLPLLLEFSCIIEQMNLELFFCHPSLCADILLLRLLSFVGWLKLNLLWLEIELVVLSLCELLEIPYDFSLSN